MACEAEDREGLALPPASLGLVEALRKSLDDAVVKHGRPQAAMIGEAA